MARRSGCRLCRRKSVLLVYRVVVPHPIKTWNNERRAYDERPATMEERIYWVRCLDSDDCRNYQDRKREKAAIRRGLFVLGDPAAPAAPPGTCRWCGEKVELADPADYRRRQRNYHRGDSHEVGRRDCLSEYLDSRTWSARSAVEKRDGGVCCDCGADDAPWEADHDVPIWNGGEHTLENLRTRCVPCHAEKTAREAAERARIRATHSDASAGARPPSGGGRFAF